MDAEPEHARHIFEIGNGRAKFAKGLQEEVWEGCAKEGPIDVVAARYVVIIELLAPCTKELDWILATAQRAACAQEGFTLI